MKHNGLPYYYIIIVLVSVFFSSCERINQNSSAKNKTLITFWHFWSEPKQKKVLYELIEQFEKENPNIDIVPTELQWSDGKSKLSLAINSGTSPDIIHIGLEWIPEFGKADVLLPIKKNTENFPAINKALQYNNTVYSIPWLINTRALIFHQNIIVPETWQEFKSHLDQIQNAPTLQYGFGINSDEPLNVSKKVLPWLWSAGSNAFRTYPLSESLDSQAIEGLTFYCSLSDKGIIEKSRTLDELFVQNKVGTILTGLWIIDHAILRENPTSYKVARKIPQKIKGIGGESILSADCLSISAKTHDSSAALRFVHYITSYQQAKKFSLAVPDAGFPADTAIRTDKDFLQSNLRAEFLQQTIHSLPIVSSPITAEAIAILENEVMKAMYRSISPESAIKSAKEKIRDLEKKQR